MLAAVGASTPAALPKDWPRNLAVTSVIGCITAIPIFLGTSYFLPTENRMVAFISVCASGTLGLLFAANAFASNAGIKGISKYVVIGFLARILVGVVHNYAFFDDQYFASETTVYTYLWDYEWLDRSMIEVANHWRTHGITSLPPTRYFAENKNALLNLYNSLLYYVAGPGRHLNFCVWNSFHAGLTAILIGILCRLCGCSESSTRFCVVLMICYPYLIFSNILMRDGVGQFFIVLGIAILHLNRSSPLGLLAVTPFVGVLFHSMRQPYLAIAFAGALLYLGTEKGVLSGSRTVLGLLLVACIGVLGLQHFLGEASFARHAKDLSGVFAPLRFPVRLLRAISGPFPWTQMWQAEVNAHEIQPMEYLTHVFNAVVLFFVVPEYYRRIRFGIIDPLVTIGLLFFLSGTVAPAIHTPYVSIGIPAMLPFAVLHTRFQQLFGAAFVATLGVFVVANVFYVSLGLQGSGVLRSLIYR